MNSAPSNSNSNSNSYLLSTNTYSFVGDCIVLLQQGDYRTLYEKIRVQNESIFSLDITAKECIKDITNRWNRHNANAWPTPQECKTLLSSDFYYNTIQRICQHFQIDQLYVDRCDNTTQEKADRCLRIISIALANNELNDCQEFYDTVICTNRYRWQFDVFMEMVQHAVIQTFSEISAFFQLHCPIPHINACNNNAWKQSLQFEQDLPKCSELLHRMVADIRTNAFIKELKETCDKLQHKPEFELSTIGVATLNACLYIIKNVDEILCNNKVTNQEKQLLSLLTNACENKLDKQVPIVNNTQQEGLKRAIKTLTTRMRYTDKPIDELIENILVKDLSVLFDDTDIVSKVIDVMDSMRSSEALAIDQYRQLCKGVHTSHILARKDFLNRPQMTGSKLQIAIGAELKRRINFADYQDHKRLKLNS